MEKMIFRLKINLYELIEDTKYFNKYKQNINSDSCTHLRATRF